MTSIEKTIRTYNATFLAAVANVSTNRFAIIILSQYVIPTSALDANRIHVGASNNGAIDFRLFLEILQQTDTIILMCLI